MDPILESVKKEALQHGDQAAALPIRRLEKIRQELTDWANREPLNPFQRHIVDHLYLLDAPEVDFNIRTILIVASPSPAAIRIGFTWKGKRIPLTLPASYVDKEKAPPRITRYLEAMLHPRGFHLLYAPRLPRKRIAVCSGLGIYGRNNLCYVAGMGSYLNLNLFFSDIPSPEDAWRDVCQMEACRACRTCLERCPTAAISPDRFLIDNQRCLAYFNESGGEWNFPDWIDPSAHHALYGCLRCQTACPVNKPHEKTIDLPVEFSEEETALLLEGKTFELLPDDLKQKVMQVEMVNYLGVLPRNLRAIFALFSQITG